MDSKIKRTGISLFAMMVVQIATAQDYEVTSATFNSPEADFSAVYKGNDLLLCSARARRNIAYEDDSLVTYYTDLFIVKEIAEGKYGEPTIMKGDLNSNYNEGHGTFNADGTKVYYTANLDQYITNKFTKSDEFRLGIFTAELVNGEWAKSQPFEHNATNARYSVAHPFITADGNEMYFSSNMPGGYGGSDIYKCNWQDGAWSTPVNLGSKVNCGGSEFYPFINEAGVLYFSTNGRPDSKGMDIYYSTMVKGKYQKPVRLNNSINSEFDEFAYQEQHGQKRGCFSSNRNNNQDDIFLFTKYTSSFEDCVENYSSSSRCTLHDGKLTGTNSMPLMYEWTMGDGTVLQGDAVSYSYKEEGDYEVTLRVIDTTTKTVVYTIGTNDLSIMDHGNPFINMQDTVYNTAAFQCRVDMDGFNSFQADKIKWVLDDGTIFNGESFIHQFKEVGMHQVKCDITGKRGADGRMPHICVFKDIICQMPAAGMASTNMQGYQEQNMQHNVSMDRESFPQYIESRQIRPYYKLILVESKEALSFNHPLFSQVTSELTEMETDSGFQYSIAEGASWEEVLPLYLEMKKLGFNELYIQDYSDFELKKRTLRVDYPENELTQERNGTVGMLYRIVLDSSDVRIPYNNPAFSKITSDIAELRTKSGYKYATMAVSDSHELDSLFSAILGTGNNKAFIEGFMPQEMSRQMLRSEPFMSGHDAQRINKELATMTDIRFENNKAGISEDSFDNLDYIATLLGSMSDYTMCISAYTCDIGSQEFNLKLSKSRAKSVVDYLVKRGVPKAKLVGLGYGSSGAIAINATEEGRAANRRVEFVIKFVNETGASR